MDRNGAADRIAVMIDADNMRAAYADDVLSEVAKYGNPTIKRVYGDWTNPHLNPWARKLNGMGLRAMHQNAYTTGKNSTDLALVIDAMDLLYDGNVEAFALVTSDSDFTSLAHRLRESGKAVYVLGEKKAPDALKNACDKFIDLGLAHGAKESEADSELAGEGEPEQDDSESAPAPAINLQSALTRAVNAVSDDEGWVSLPALGNQLIRTHPSFDARNFREGSDARLSTLVAEQNYLETSGTGNAMRVRVKGSTPAKGAKVATQAPPKKAPAKRAGAKKAAASKSTAAQKPTVTQTRKD